MAKKPTPKTDTASSKPVAKVSAVRNSPIPREPVVSTKTAPVGTPIAKKLVTHQDIAVRAYYISRSSECGDQLHNWLRAEREMKA